MGSDSSERRKTGRKGKGPPGRMDPADVIALEIKTVCETFRDKLGLRR